jgi:hypothetical protein
MTPATPAEAEGTQPAVARETWPYTDRRGAAVYTDQFRYLVAPRLAEFAAKNHIMELGRDLDLRNSAFHHPAVAVTPILEFKRRAP